MTRTLADLL